MRIWTVIDEAEYIEFEKNKCLVCDSTKAMANDAYIYKICYDWMSEQLRLKVKSENKYPRWFWLYTDNFNPYMDKLEVCHVVGRHYILIFDVDEKEVLLSDFDLWHCCLNSGHIEESEEETEEYDKKLDELGISSSEVFDFDYETEHKSELLQQLREEYYESWKKIFNLESKNDYLYAEERRIQGVIWKLDKNDLIDVRIVDITQDELDKYESSFDED